MKAIILAAGYATRLYPITEKFSKALLPIKNKPIINYIVESLYKIEKIDNIFVITNDLFFQDFVSWQEKYNYKKVTIINDQTTDDKNKLGAIGDIHYTIKNANINEETLIIAGDTFFEFELKDFENFYSQNKISAVCVKEEREKDLTRFGIAEINDGKIINIEEKPAQPKSNNVIYACYLFNKEDLAMINNYLEDGNTPDAPGHFVAWLCKRKRIQPFKINGYCLDIGTHESYANAQHIKS